MVRWSQRARADLKAIHDYIAKDSPLNAKSVAREILRRAAQVAETPRIGQRVPELNDADIREVPVHAWRVIYQIRGDEVIVVTLVHRRRVPGPAAISG